MKTCPHCGKPLKLNAGKGRQNIKQNLKALPTLFKKAPPKGDKCDTCPYKPKE